MHAFILVNWSDWLTRHLVISLFDLISLIDLRSRRNDYSVQVFKTVQGIRGWIGPFDIVFTAYCCRMFVPASFVFYIICYLLADRGFKCCLLNLHVVNVAKLYLSSAVSS